MKIVTQPLDLPDDAVEQMRGVLSAAERARADRYIFAKHRRRFIVGRAILRHHLAHFLAQPSDQIDILASKHGKPYVQHPTLQFNVSHSHELAVYGFVDDRALGIDIEFVRERVNMAAVAKRFFSDAEQTSLFDYPNTEQLTAFYRIWTCKEAYLKALGDGLTRPTRSFTVSAGARPCLLADDLGPVAPTHYSLEPVDLPQGYTGTVCTGASL